MIQAKMTSHNRSSPVKKLVSPNRLTQTSIGEVSPLYSPISSPSNRSDLMLDSPQSLAAVTPIITTKVSRISSPFSLSRRGSAITQATLDSSLSPSTSTKTLLDRPKIRPECRSLSKSAQTLNDSLVYLEGPRVYACAKCRTHLTSYDDILSKQFHGRHGRAYLFDNAVNVRLGPVQERWLMTGFHEVCDINCKRCNHLVGWTYVKAFEQNQKYKEGKFIIEKINLFMENTNGFVPSKRSRNGPGNKQGGSWDSRPVSDYVRSHRDD